MEQVLQCGGHAGGLFVSRWEQHELANSIAHTHSSTACLHTEHEREGNCITETT